MTTTNEPYILKAIAGALADFDQAAGPSNINEPYFALACRLLELSNAAPGIYPEAQAEADAAGRARKLGHDESSIRDSWRSAQRHVGSTAAHVPAPTHPNGQVPTSQGLADLAAYAASRGVPAEVFERAGWSDATLWEVAHTDKTGKPGVRLTHDEPLRPIRTRRAIRFETDAGPRWRLIDEDKPKPKYWHPFNTHTDATKAWYRLGEALALAAQCGYLALVNGEASVVVAQHWGVPATCETGGGEKLTPPQLLQLLRAVWPGLILVVLDCDGKGQKAAPKKREQYRTAGYADARAVDLNLGSTDDIADFCRLHQSRSVAQLVACADLPEPAQANQATPAGLYTQSQANMAQLARLGYQFRLNLCGNLIEVNDEPIDDNKAAEIRMALRDEGVKRFGAYEDAWTTYAVRDKYHPVRDYLLALRWDGVARRIGQLATYFQGDNPLVTYQDGRECSLVNVYVHRWLIGAVAKALDGKQNAMLVFAGAQGLGKSHFARWLCPSELRERYYLEHGINVRDKDNAIRLMQMFLWEVGELDATTRKQDVAELKHFVSQENVTVRKSYGRYDTRGPALASMIGTVNGSEFLADDTGNRRFFVIDLQALDWAYQQLDLDQLWAEAVARYRAGEPWRLLPEESAAQTAHNRGFLADSIVGDYIRKHFFITHDPAHTMTLAAIIDHLLASQVRLPQSDRALQMDISRTMAALGVQKQRTATQRYYVGLYPR